jgi:protein tyrosine phosphatase type 4A
MHFSVETDKSAIETQSLRVLDQQQRHESFLSWMQRKWQQIQTRIKHEKLDLELLLCDCPDNEHLSEFGMMLKSHSITHVVRLCSATTYNAQELAASGIIVHEMYTEDGKTPTKETIAQYRDLVRMAIDTKENAIAIHCVSGIGRAPLFVCMVCFID